MDEREDEDQQQDATEGPARRGPAEGVRIIGAEEAAEALESGHASGRQPSDVPRYGDVPPAPSGPRPTHRFPLPASVDPAQVVPRPPLARDASRVPQSPVERAGSEGAGSEREWYGPGTGPEPVWPDPGRADRGSDRTASPSPEVGLNREQSPTGEPGGGAVNDYEPRPGVEAEAEVQRRVIPPLSPTPSQRTTPTPATPTQVTPTPTQVTPRLPGPGQSVELPHWADPPTGEVPRLFADGGDESIPRAAGSSPGGPMSGPTWRDEHSGWDDDYEPSLLADDDIRVGAMDDARADRYDPDSYEDDAAYGAGPEDIGDEGSGAPFDDEDYDEYDTAPPTRRRMRGRVGSRGSAYRSTRLPRPRRGHVGAPAAPSDGFDEEVDDYGAEPRAGGARHRDTSALVRWTTGVGIGVAGVILFLLGPVTALLLVIAVVFMAQAECYGVLRRAGYRPASLLGLVAMLAIMIAAYIKGESALPLVLVLTVVFAMIWYLAGVIRGRPTINIAMTLLGFMWVGFLGSFAALLLNPSTFPHRHGVAFLFGAVMATVGYDAGAYVIGARFGKRPLAPNISPGKTLEGLIGGMVVAVVSSVVIVSQFFPWTLKRALILGLVVAVVAPLGDLCESMIKRDIGVKDMGQLLPGHGGVLDRFDAMLFVLPATYYLIRVFNIA